MGPSTPSVFGSIGSLFRDIGFHPNRRAPLAPPVVEIDGMPLYERKQKMGDIWEGEEAALAFEQGLLKSLSDEEGKEEGSTSDGQQSQGPGDEEKIDENASESDSDGDDRELAVVFRNESPVTLLLCWVSETGEPYHFYRLKPKASKNKNDQEGSSMEDDDFQLLDTDHLEHTQPGHAFCLGYVENQKEIKHFRKLRSLSHHRVKGKARGEVEDDSENRSSIVVGGYRPLGVAFRSSSASSSSSSMLSRCMHLVTISHTSLCGQEQHLRRSRHSRLSCFSASPWCLGSKRKRSDEDDDNEIDDVDQRSQERKDFSKALNQDGWRVSSRWVRSQSAPYDTTSKLYHDGKLGGWPCRLEPNWSDGEHVSAAKLERDIREASRLLPPHARKYLQKNCKIWVNRSLSWGPSVCPIKGHGCCYHPSKGWLAKNGLSKEKHMCVEVNDAPRYKNDCDLWGPGGVMLHELSHAYHHGMIPDGYENKEIQKCYDLAMEEGLYDSVKYHSEFNEDNGKRKMCMARAYACTNAMEYFAELSAAFLGGLHESEEFNKWYPFNRNQLRMHDPRAYELLSRLWKVHPERAHKKNRKDNN